MLAERQRLTTNLSTLHEGINLRVEDVYVPLGLVERKKISKRQDDISPERGSEIYQELEITQKFQNHEFLTQVFKQKNTPKSKGKRIAIIGEPGAGKTTLLQQIADYLSKESNPSIVIWVSLADLQGKKLEKYLEATTLNKVISKNGRQFESQIKDDFEKQFHQDRVWLLLDGLDEMSVNSGNALTDIARQIRESGCINQARIVLTCRLNLWDGGSNALDDFDIYRTLDFSYPEQVDKFIDKWFTAIHEPDRGQRLCNTLKEPGKERIQDLVKNPLRLTLLCVNWQAREGKLPDTQAGLYQQLVDDFYKWKKEEFATKAAQRQELNIKLGELAKEAIDKEATRFRLRGEFVNQFLGEDEEGTLLNLALRLGWLNKVGEDIDKKPVYAFFHASFQEYFAATAINDNDWEFFLPKNHKNKPVKNKKYRIFESEWKQTILLWFGRKDLPKEEKEAFIQALIVFKDGCVNYEGKDFYGYRAYFLAAVVIAEFKNCDRADEIIKQIINWKLDYFSEIQQQARAALQETQRTKAIATLVQLLETSQDEDTRMQVVVSLGEIGTGNEQAITALVQLLETSQDEDTPMQVAVSLGKIGAGNGQAIAALVQLLETSQDESTRWQAAESLGKIGTGNEKASAALVQLLKTSQYEDTRRKAAESLGKIDPGNETASAALVQLLKTSHYEDTRRLAAESLGKIDPGNETAIAALVQLLKTSRDRFTRGQAAESLEKIGTGNEQAVAALVQLLKLSQDEDIRRRAAESLGKIDPGNEQAIAALVQLLKTSHYEDTRGLAAESLGKIDPGNKTAIAALVQRLETSQDESICILVAQNLGKIGAGNEQAIAALVQLLKTSQDESTRRWAAHSLGEIVTNNKDRYSVLQTLSGYKLNNDMYNLIWKHAQNMSYPDFYQAWHQPFFVTRLVRSVRSMFW